MLVLLILFDDMESSLPDSDEEFLPAKLDA